MANTLTITREHLDNDNYYIGPDVTNYDGDIVLEPDLGTVEFTTGILATGSIRAGRGTGIIASGSISAGTNIISSRSIRSDCDIEAGKNIHSGWDIYARWGVYAGGNITAMDDIEARFDIEAGGAIKAGQGIRAGLSIECKTLSAGLPIFAGTATWTTPDKEDTQIRCEQLCGDVVYGELVLKGEQEVA